MIFIGTVLASLQRLCNILFEVVVIRFCFCLPYPGILDLGEMHDYKGANGMII